MPVTLTDTALREIATIIRQQGLDAEKVRLRVGVKGGGCSGFSYILDLTETQKDSDEVWEYDVALDARGMVTAKAGSCGSGCGCAGGTTEAAAHDDHHHADEDCCGGGHDHGHHHHHHEEDDCCGGGHAHAHAHHHHGASGGCCGGSAKAAPAAVASGSETASFKLRVVCDPKSYLYLNGTVIGFKDEIMGRGFVFENPNATTTCGCGSSFSA